MFISITESLNIYRSAAGRVKKLDVEVKAESS